MDIRESHGARSLVARTSQSGWWRSGAERTRCFLLTVNMVNLPFTNYKCGIMLVLKEQRFD